MLQRNCVLRCLAYTFSIFYHLSITIVECVRNSCSLLYFAKLTHMRYHVPTAVKCPKGQSSSGIGNTYQTNPIKPLQDNTQKSGGQGLGIKVFKVLVSSRKVRHQPNEGGSIWRSWCHIASSNSCSIRKSLKHDKGNFCPLPDTPMTIVTIFSTVYVPAQAQTTQWLLLSEKSTSCSPK